MAGEVCIPAAPPIHTNGRSNTAQRLRCGYLLRKSNCLAFHDGEMKRLIAALLLTSSFCALGVRAEEPDGNYTFATKEEALKRAKEMGCEGAYEWFGVWSPCEEDGGEDDHSGHDHSGHSH